MIQQIVRVKSNKEIADGLFLMKFDSVKLAASARPGQFLNIRAMQHWSPMLLRRPFSISRVVGSSIELLYNVVGRGPNSFPRNGQETILISLALWDAHFNGISQWEQR